MSDSVDYVKNAKGIVNEFHGLSTEDKKSYLHIFQMLNIKPDSVQRNDPLINKYKDLPPNERGFSLNKMVIIEQYNSMPFVMPFLSNGFIRAKIIDAYSDCCDGADSDASGYRCLHFISEDITMKLACQYLEEAVPNGYNNFSVDLLEKLPQDWRVMVAREGSVCLYIMGDKFDELEKLRGELMFDELDLLGEDTLKGYLGCTLHSMEMSTLMYKEDTFVGQRPSGEAEMNLIRKMIKDKTVTTRIWWD